MVLVVVVAVAVAVAVGDDAVFDDGGVMINAIAMAYSASRLEEFNEHVPDQTQYVRFLLMRTGITMLGLCSVVFCVAAGSAVASAAAVSGVAVLAQYVLFLLMHAGITMLGFSSVVFCVVAASTLLAWTMSPSLKRRRRGTGLGFMPRTDVETDGRTKMLKLLEGKVLCTRRYYGKVSWRNTWMDGW